MAETTTKATTCAFCSGKGLDPFELLSPMSKCQVCGGSGEVKVEKPTIKCAFCNGRGIYPHTRLTCTVCNGKGLITVKGSTKTCDACGGNGKGADSLPCLSCGGKGIVAK